jgi:hypothetical protein
LFCRPHHLNLTVTSLYAHIYGQSFWFTSSCCIRNIPGGRLVTKRKKIRQSLSLAPAIPSPWGKAHPHSARPPGGKGMNCTFQLGPNGPRPVLIDLNFAGSSSAL